MKLQIHIGWLIFFGLLLITIGWQLNDWLKIPFQTITLKQRKNFDIVTFKLPNSHDPDVFGSPYWRARHFLAELTPCPACRIEAISHEKFFHDYVNIKTGKKFFNKKNYEDWIKKLNEQKSKNKS